MQNGKQKDNIERFFGLEDHFKWLLLALVTAAIIVVLFPSLIISQRLYVSGDVVERDIKATKDFLFEDKPATERQRAQAVEAILTVYDHNTALTTQLIQRVDTAFEDMRGVVDVAVPPAEHTKAANENEVKPPVEAADTPAAEGQGTAPSLHELLTVHKPAFEKSMGITFSKGAFAILEKEGFQVFFR